MGRFRSVCNDVLTDRSSRTNLSGKLCSRKGMSPSDVGHKRSGRCSLAKSTVAIDPESGTQNRGSTMAFHTLVEETVLLPRPDETASTV